MTAGGYAWPTANVDMVERAGANVEAPRDISKRQCDEHQA